MATISAAYSIIVLSSASRAWMRTVFEEAGSAHLLHYLDVPNAVCKARLHRRNTSGLHEFLVSDEDFELFTSYFVPPSADESFNVVVHRITNETQPTTTKA